MKSLERGVGGDGVRLLDSRLAVPQSPQHFKVRVDRAVGSAGWKGCSIGKVGGGVTSCRMSVQQ